MNEILTQLSSGGATKTNNAVDYNGDAIVERFNQVQSASRLKSSQSFRQLKDERDKAVNEVCWRFLVCCVSFLELSFIG